MDVERPKRCEECNSPLAGDQRYCLACGARVGTHGPQLHALLRGVGSRVYRREGSPGAAPVAELGRAPAQAQAPGPAAQPAGPWLRLPPARVSALLVLVFLGFGVLLGHVARAPSSATLAATRGPVKLVLAPSRPSAPTTTSSEAATSESSSASAEAPESEAEATPAPAATNTSTGTSTSGSSKSSAGSGSSGSSGSAGSKGSSKSESTALAKAEAQAPAKKLPPIKHVFVIMLSDQPYASAFGPSSTAPYLTGKLEHEGELLPHFYAVAHDELADGAALISGQGPTVETAANCPTYSEIAATGTGPDEQVLGTGCVYPASTQTLPGQLEAKGMSWRAYVQGIDEPGSQASACPHPAVGAADPTANDTASSGAYATFDNPFVYFGSIVGSPRCASDDVGLSALKGDLAKAKSTPSFSYIVPDRCFDGSPTPCTPGAASGMAQASTFLAQVVPEITGSKAYKESGLLVITVDEAPATGPFADSSACCGQPLFPNAPSKSALGTPRGGGLVGALLLSPYVKAGTSSEEPFNDFSLLSTVEDLFGLTHIGYASLPNVSAFEAALFTAGKT